MRTLLSDRRWLAPFACLYGWGVGLRNRLFDLGVLRSKSYPVPVICVGNITVGGTGKTPHVEYILSLLTARYRVAVVSRGYKRRTRGLVVASEASTAEEIGDEPQQIHLKYPHVQLVVDGNRRRAIEWLLALPEQMRPEVIVMDDGLQHRYVLPDYSILLMDASHPLWEDKLLPMGSLRESEYARYRASAVIVSKCPSSLNPIEYTLLERNLQLYPHQDLFFSRMKPMEPRPVSSLCSEMKEGKAQSILRRGCKIIALAGIAQPESFAEQLGLHYRVVEVLGYPDHHNFSLRDLLALDELYSRLSTSGEEIYVVCTEKDAMRLLPLRASLSPALWDCLYYQPIEVEIVGETHTLKEILVGVVEGKLR